MKHYGVTVLSGLFALGLLASSALSDLGFVTEDLKKNGGVEAIGSYWDFHFDAHEGPSDGVAIVFGTVNLAGFPEHGAGPGVANKSLKLSWSTRLAGRIVARGTAADGGWNPTAFGQQDWTAEYLLPSTGQTFIQLGSATDGGSYPEAHRDASTMYAVSVMPADNLVTLVEVDGVPEVDEEGAPELDENDEIVWESAPVAVARLTSSVTESGGVYTYTYKIENLGDADLDFLIPEITSAAFPSGWFGTVSTSSYDEISFNDTDDPFSQNAACSVDLLGTYSSEHVVTGQVYVPEGRLVYGGSSTISDAYYDGVLMANVVEFHVTEATDLGILTRYAPDLEEVDDVVGLSAGPSYELYDYDFATGEDNEYRVRTGSGVNGQEATTVTTIEN